MLACVSVYIVGSGVGGGEEKVSSNQPYPPRGRGPDRGSQSQRLRQLRFMMSPATRSECKINFARPKTLVEIKIVYIVSGYL